MKKVLSLLFAFVFIFTFMPMVANANELNGFDATYYATKYPDVVAVYGTDEDALYLHYLNFGYNEGRFKNANEEATGIITEPIVTPSKSYTLYPTYIDVDKASQVVTYVKDGQVVMQMPCVTGCVKTHHDTPNGTWKIMTHTKGKTLKGPTWKVWVDYWMRFTPDSCGLHDASWRDDSEFNPNTYLTDGSHGCVNLRHDDAQALFNMVDVGTIVVVHD